MSDTRRRPGWVDRQDEDHIVDIVTDESDIEVPTRLPVVVGDIQDTFDRITDA